MTEHAGFLAADTEFEDLCFEFGIELDDIVRVTAPPPPPPPQPATASSSATFQHHHNCHHYSHSHKSRINNLTIHVVHQQTTETPQQRKEKGESAPASGGEEVTYKIDITANRCASNSTSLQMLTQVETRKHRESGEHLCRAAQPHP